jgi:hypothetical protein
MNRMPPGRPPLPRHSEGTVHGEGRHARPDDALDASGARQYVIGPDGQRYRRMELPQPPGEVLAVRDHGRTPLRPYPR